MKDQRARDAREALAARREHSKGRGNFPRTRPARDLVGESPRDRWTAGLRKEEDPRSAPKGNVTKGQRDRNPDLVMRDEEVPELQGAAPASGFESAVAAAENEIVQRHAERPPARPNARRSSAAKRRALKRAAPRKLRRPRPPAMVVRQAPKSAEKTGRKAAVERKPQVGKPRTGTVRSARPKTVRGSRAGLGT